MTGAPSLKFFSAMEAEHCKEFGNDLTFRTTNYGLETTPKTEWDIIARRKGKTDAQFEAILKGEFPQIGLGSNHHGRRIPDILELMKLEVCVSAKLSEEEVTAIVLYTGPMVTFLPFDFHLLE